jgi:hypothetical protein
MPETTSSEGERLLAEFVWLRAVRKWLALLEPEMREAGALPLLASYLSLRERELSDQQAGLRRSHLRLVASS